MSGQYPPPNPSHPFGRAAHHQRAPTLPPWGHHTPQPSGMNIMGNPMNYFGSPRVGMSNRASSQPWAPLQTHPKPMDPNPLYGLQMMRAPGEQYQQEESMDLSSHAPPDTLRNGTELNGEDSIATSVIAPNPLREPSIICPETPALNCSKSQDTTNQKSVEPFCSTEDVSVNSEVLTKPQPSSFKSNTSNSMVGLSSNLNESETEISLTKAEPSSMPPVPLIDKSNTVFTKNLEHEQPKFDTFVKDTSEKANEEKEETLDSIRKSIENFDNSSLTSDPPSLETSQSLMNSTLSDETDDSKLVVAESSAADIFNSSPDPLTSVSQETDTSVGSGQPFIPKVVPEKTSQTPSNAVAEEPQPSVENVEILLENMFNSQEETSCSSQTSNSSVPKSVIVTQGARTPLETLKPDVNISKPLKAEELAMTLAADDPLEELVKGGKKEETVKTELMDEIEKKLELLTESGFTDQSKSNILSNVDQLSVPLEKDSCIKEETRNTENNSKLINLPTSVNKNDANAQSIEPSTSKSEDTESETKLEVPLTSVKSETEGKNNETGSSNNPFIEVESELEKMFAGIVEPAEEVGSDSSSRPLVIDSKKSSATKKQAVKRKKANSRRASDNSMFGGSSEETATPKKKGRKRISEGGSEKGSKKTKSDHGEGSKRGKLSKDANNDKLKGPFLRIEGPKESPASVVVVNSGVRADDEDGTDKASTRRKHNVAQRNEWVTRNAGLVYSSSAMSARYNSDKADLSWVCVFCKRGPHCSGGLGGEPAGDLFGPYRVPATPPHDILVTTPGTVSDHDLREEQKRRGGGKLPKSLRASGGADQFLHKVAKKNKRSQSEDSLESQAGVLAVEGGYEVWMHGPCAEWAPGLTLIGSQLVGLEDAVWAALRTRCTHCAETGAGISCVVRSCPTRMHYSCAVLSGWLLDTDTFIAHCSVHRTRLRPS